jgi:hypothetical protein
MLPLVAARNDITDRRMQKKERVERYRLAVLSVNALESITIASSILLAWNSCYRLANHVGAKYTEPIGPRISEKWVV